MTGNCVEIGSCLFRIHILPDRHRTQSFRRQFLSPFLYRVLLGFKIGSCDLSIYGDVTIKLPLLDIWKSCLYLPSRN